jgi:heat-inducible transcriptional repressor
VQSAAVVTLPASPQARARRVELVLLQERAVLIVLILQSGVVRQHVERVSEALGELDLETLHRRLNLLVDGKTARECRRLAEGLEGCERHFAELVARMLQQADQQTFEQIYYDGLSHMLGQPEFAASERVRPVVELLEHSQTLGAFLADATSTEDVRVIIGSEHRLESLRVTATVLARYGRGDGVRGVLGIVGPTRLQYWRAVPMVRLMANVMNVLVERSYQS